MRMRSKVVGAAGAAVLSVAVGLVGGGTAHASFSHSPYELVNYGTGKCLSVWQGSYAEWAPLVQEPCTHDPSQLWYQGWNDEFRWWFNAQSGLCIEPATGINSDGVPLVQMQCSIDTVHTQHWNNLLVRYQGTDIAYAIVNNNGHTLPGHACIDLADGSDADGATEQVWSCSTGNVNQAWRIVD